MHDPKKWWHMLARFNYGSLKIFFLWRHPGATTAAPVLLCLAGQVMTKRTLTWTERLEKL